MSNWFKGKIMTSSLGFKNIEHRIKTSSSYLGCHTCTFFVKENAFKSNLFGLIMEDESNHTD